MRGFYKFAGGADSFRREPADGDRNERQACRAHWVEEACGAGFFFERGRGGRGGHRHGMGHGRRGGFFERFGGGFPGGAGMRAARMLAAGDLQLVILVMLNERPRHGYEIIKALEEKSSGIYTPSPGVVYPALTYLEEVGHASCSSEGTKKLYTITDQGREYLERHRETADETLDHLARFGEKMARFQKQFVRDENEEEDFARPGRREDLRGQRAEWRRMKEQFREVREELKEAIFEKMDSTLEEKQRILAVLRTAIAEIRKPSRAAHSEESSEDPAED